MVTTPRDFFFQISDDNVSHIYRKSINTLSVSTYLNNSITSTTSNSIKIVTIYSQFGNMSPSTKNIPPISSKSQ
jgi:hypothetical protein